MSNGTKNRALAVLVAASFALLAWVGHPLWRPLLVAAVLAGGLWGIHERLVRMLGNRRTLASILFTFAVVLLILIPIAALAAIAVQEALNMAHIVRESVQSSGVNGLIERAPRPIEGWLRRLQGHLPARLDDVRDEITSGSKWALSTLTGTLTVIANFTFDLVMMLIALFFFLRDGQALVGWLYQAAPLPAGRVQELMTEFRNVAKLVLGANFITGAVQATVATVGYVIAGAPSPIFFGLVTLFASFIPSVGTAIVSIPVAAIVFLMGHPWAALFLALWSILLVSLIDNILRPYLIRGGGQLHGALVFFSLIGGIAAFGATGLFLGPIALTFFLASVRIARRMPNPHAPPRS